MMSGDLQRKLTTILAADAAGYSTAMGRDEVRTVAELRAARDVFARFVSRHGGRIANTAGDGLIADFPSVVEAVQCAIEVQGELRSLDRAGREPLLFRIGIHLGDVIVDGQDLLGDGVNIAARLESLAEPGGVLISQQVYDQVATKLSVGFEFVGDRRPKNLTSDVAVYRVTMRGLDDPFPMELGQPAQPAPKPEAATVQAAAPEPHRAPLAPDRAADRNLAAMTRRFGLAAGALFAVDVATGLPFWSQWPILCISLLYGWRVAPLLQRGKLSVFVIRAAFGAAFFAGLNLFSPQGGTWSIWPGGALLVFAALSYARSART